MCGLMLLAYYDTRRYFPFLTCKIGRTVQADLHGSNLIVVSYVDFTSGIRSIRPPDAATYQSALRGSEPSLSPLSERLPDVDDDASAPIARSQ